MVVFRVGLISRWDSTTGEVVQIEGHGTISLEDKIDGDEEDVMSE